MAPSVSCLVVSRTPGLLNRLLQSLEAARVFWGPQDEVLCSWNGSRDDEALILPPAGLRFHLASRSAYHFAANMNTLARLASGDILAILNDDLILDAGSLDRAIQVLCSRPDVALVGGRLRTSSGCLSHAGILFSNSGRPYNRFRPDRLGRLIDPDSLEVQESGPMPAVTGALMVLHRADLERVGFRETFRVCGEDVALCLDLQDRTGRSAYYASDVTGVHDEKSTRGDTLDHYDLDQVAELVSESCGRSASLRASLAHWAVQEADVLEALVHRLVREQDQRASTVEAVAPSAMPSPSLHQALDAMHSQLNALQQGLDATQQQVRTLLLLHHQRRRPWRALVQAYWGSVCGFWRLGSRRSS